MYFKNLAVIYFSFEILMSDSLKIDSFLKMSQNQVVL